VIVSRTISADNPAAFVTQSPFEPNELLELQRAFRGWGSPCREIDLHHHATAGGGRRARSANRTRCRGRLRAARAPRRICPD